MLLGYYFLLEDCTVFLSQPTLANLEAQGLFCLEVSKTFLLEFFFGGVNDVISKI